MAYESDVVRAAREYREQLARNEDEALRQMARYWLQMEQELRASFEALYAEYAELASTGQPVPVQTIYNMDRYRDMMRQVQTELPYYQSNVEDLIAEYQRQDFVLGLDSANAIIKAAGPESGIWTRVYKEAAENVAGFAGNGAPLSQLLQVSYGDLSTAIVDALVKGVALGKGADATAREMMRAAQSETYERFLRIARTEINRSYRLANAEQYKRSGVVEKVLRLCYAPTACFACLEMDGEECPNGICDDHPNGKCTTVVQTVGGVVPEWQKGSDWLLEQDEATQRKIMGDGRYELWKDGVSLRDMVMMRENPIWGGSPSTVSLETLLQQKELGLI